MREEASERASLYVSIKGRKLLQREAKLKTPIVHAFLVRNTTLLLMTYMRLSARLSRKSFSAITSQPPVLSPTPSTLSRFSPKANAPCADALAHPRQQHVVQQQAITPGLADVEDGGWGRLVGREPAIQRRREWGQRKVVLMKVVHRPHDVARHQPPAPDHEQPVSVTLSQCNNAGDTVNSAITLARRAACVRV